MRERVEPAEADLHRLADAAHHAPAANPVAEQRARLNAFARPGRGGAATAAAPASDGWEEF